MCGILGVWRFDHHPVDIETVRKGLESLRHRGPDDEGYVLINTSSGSWVAHRGDKTDARLALPSLAQAQGSYDLVLGHTRLSILDLSPAGHQPMVSPDGMLCVAFNGEIYNFQEIRRELQARGHDFHTNSDTEVILHAYREWGVDCLHRFNGMWAFALWDASKHRLFVARDRFGVKPLVYYASQDGFVCASEIKAIVADPTLPREIDAEALHHYLSLMAVPAPLTIYKGIRKLLPGHYMLVDAGSIQIQRYWVLVPGDLTDETEDQAVEHLDSLLQDAVRLRLIADVPVGAFLSGGVDSSVVSAIAARQNGTAGLRTFSIGFSGLRQFDESIWAGRVAEHIGAQHTNFELSLAFQEAFTGFARLMDEPFASPSVLGVYLLAREASRHVKVVLTGDGGDEVFAGYLPRHVGVDQYWDGFTRRPLGWLRAQTAVNGLQPLRWKTERPIQRVLRRWQWERLPEQTVRDRYYLRTIMFASDAEKEALYAPEWAYHARGLRTESALMGQFPNTSADRLARWQLFDLHTTLADEMLAKVDRATMAWGLEARVPLLDYRVVRYAMSLPTAFKIRDNHGKHLLKKVAERYVSPETLHRQKQGFAVPLAIWFRSELRDFVREILDTSLLRRQGIFRPEVVDRIVLSHQSDPQTDYSILIFNLICFQIWYQECFRHA